MQHLHLHLQINAISSYEEIDCAVISIHGIIMKKYTLPNLFLMDIVHKVCVVQSGLRSVGAFVTLVK